MLTLEAGGGRPGTTPRHVDAASAASSQVDGGGMTGMVLRVVRAEIRVLDVGETSTGLHRAGCSEAGGSITWTATSRPVITDRLMER